MNEMITKTLKGNLTYKNTTILTYQIHYPQIVLSSYDIGKEIFNQYNFKKALLLEHYCKTELYVQAKELYDYNHSHGYPIMVYEVILENTITYNKQNIVSLYTDEYQFTGGAHGSTIRKSQNWNLINGSLIPLSYFYPYDPYYMIHIIKQINQQIKEQLKENPSQYFENYCELVLQNFRLDQYFITPDSIVIFFQQYDIAPYSSGIPTFSISKKEG